MYHFWIGEEKHHILFFMEIQLLTHIPLNDSCLDIVNIICALLYSKCVLI